MTAGTVGRTKKPAKRQNYKITFDVLAQLKAIAILEDRSDTAQLERWIREGAETWGRENPSKAEQLKTLAAKLLADLEAEAEAD